MIFISLVWLVISILAYLSGRVHGINQSVKALERYSKAAELAGGAPLPIEPPKKGKTETPKNVHHVCGGQWGKWSDCRVNLVTPQGKPTGNQVSGQRRDCTGCGEKEVRTDL